MRRRNLENLERDIYRALLFKWSTTHYTKPINIFRPLIIQLHQYIYRHTPPRSLEASTEKVELCLID